VGYLVLSERPGSARDVLEYSGKAFVRHTRASKGAFSQPPARLARRRCPWGGVEGPLADPADLPLSERLIPRARFGYNGVGAPRARGIRAMVLGGPWAAGVSASQSPPSGFVSPLDGQNQPRSA
jgi:hypothetical protein